MATAAGGPKSGKLDEAQASARSCAGRPDFFPCDGGQSVCATHSHGRCFKLHWCCHLGWCHCKYVYQPMTSVCQLPSTPVPSNPSDHTPSFNLSVSLAERFLRTAPSMVAPASQHSPKFCVIAKLFMDDYVVKRINGKMCYVQRLPLTPPPKTQATPATPPSMLRSPKPHPTPKRQPQPQRSNQKPPQTTKASPPAVDQKLIGQKPNPCSSPSSSEDSGINAVGGAYTESYDEEEEEEEEDEDEDEGEEEEMSSSDVEWSHGSLWEQEFSLLAPSRSMVEIIENIETTV